MAIGILVDEATVEIENIHTQMGRAPSIARAVRLGNAQTAIPRLLAMVCILAVFISSFFMQGAVRAMFVPLSLAVGFSMVASYLLSSTFVPVLSVWLLRHVHLGDSHAEQASARYPPTRPTTPRGRPLAAVLGIGFVPVLSIASGSGYEGLLTRIVRFRWGLVAAYLVVSLADHLGTGLAAGHGDFPDHRHRPIPPSHPRRRTEPTSTRPSRSP